VYRKVAWKAKEHIESVTDLLKKYVNSKAALYVAWQVGDVARYDKERLEDVIEAYSKYSDIIMRFEGINAAMWQSV
jgi:argonaute-like protein implicated in RNA metabolism and viral defense